MKFKGQRGWGQMKKPEGKVKKSLRSAYYGQAPSHSHKCWIRMKIGACQK